MELSGAIEFIFIMRKREDWKNSLGDWHLIPGKAENNYCLFSCHVFSPAAFLLYFFSLVQRFYLAECCQNTQTSELKDVPVA